MNRPDILIPPARSWRDIPQQVKPRAMSVEGRRRVMWGTMKTAAAVVILAGLAWAGLEIAGALRGRPQQVAATETVPVKDVILVTDGVLDQKWLVRTLALPKGATLMQLDLYQLRAQLVASGQVRSATLTRTFPSTLTVSLSENSPVARIKEEPAGDADARTLLVARDGTVFDGVGFDRELVETLPWLEGVKLARRGDRYAPIADMNTVADLLGSAKFSAEHLYRTWQAVSLARLATDREIEVRASGVACIRFGTTQDYFRQLAWLDSLLDAARAKTDQPIREINLTVGPQVPVAFDDPALAPPVIDPKTGKPLPANAARPTPTRLPLAPTSRTDLYRKIKL